MWHGGRVGSDQGVKATDESPHLVHRTAYHQQPQASGWAAVPPTAGLPAAITSVVLANTVIDIVKTF